MFCFCLVGINSVKADSSYTFDATASDAYIDSGSSELYNTVWTKQTGSVQALGTYAFVGQLCTLTSTYTTLTPSADSTPQEWDLGAGTSHYTALDTNDGDTSYISEAHDDQVDFCAMDDLSPYPDAITQLTLYVVGKRVGGTPSSGFEILVKNATSGTVYESATQTLSTNYASKSVSYTTTPWDGGNSWQGSDVDSLILGVRSDCHGGSVYVTQFSVRVYYKMFKIYRAFPVSFDTSSLSGLTLTGASLKLYGRTGGDSSETDFSLIVQNDSAGIFPHDPVVAGDYNKSSYANAGGAFNTVDWSSAGYNTITLNATGMSMINTTGYTRLCLRSDKDIAGTPPPGTSTADDAQYVSFYTLEQGASYVEQLIVTVSKQVVSFIVGEVISFLSSSSMNVHLNFVSGEVLKLNDYAAVTKHLNFVAAETLRMFADLTFTKHLFITIIEVLASDRLGFFSYLSATVPTENSFFIIMIGALFLSALVLFVLAFKHEKDK